MKKYFFPFFLTLSSLSALADEPFKIVIFADNGSTARAQEFERYLRSDVAPFNRMRAQDLQISVRTLTGEDNKMNCQRDAVVNRVMTCDSTFLQSQAGNAMAVAIPSTPFDAAVPMGSGGSVPVGSMNLPLDVMVHEMLHTAGVSDEYPYAAGEEQSRFCNPPVPSMNFAYFAPTPPYASDADARGKHGPPTVLWMPRILPATPVISDLNTLGTNLVGPRAGQQKIGLYPGGSCPPDSTGKDSWRPYDDSIMRRRSMVDPTVYPIYEQAFIDYIQPRLGRPLSLGRRTAADAARLAALEIEVNDPDVQILPDSATGAVSEE